MMLRDKDVQRFLYLALRNQPDEAIAFTAKAGEWESLFREVLKSRRNGERPSQAQRRIPYKPEEETENESSAAAREAVPALIEEAKAAKAENQPPTPDETEKRIVERRPQAFSGGPPPHAVRKHALQLNELASSYRESLPW